MTSVTAYDLALQRSAGKILSHLDVGPSSVCRKLMSLEQSQRGLITPRLNIFENSPILDDYLLKTVKMLMIYKLSR